MRVSMLRLSDEPDVAALSRRASGGGLHSTLERADSPICKAQPLRHCLNDNLEERLTERRILLHHMIVGIKGKLVEHAGEFGPDRRAARSTGDEAHLANDRMAPETAYAHHAVAIFDKNSDTTVKNEMHRVGRLALTGDVVTGLDLEPFATFGQIVGIFRAAQRICQPCD